MRRHDVITRFAAARQHPVRVRRRGDDDLNPGMGRPDALTPAAVLVPLVDRDEGLTILLTQRTDHLRDHAGQISFPGGRVEEQDMSHEGTALREAEEEIGLRTDLVELVGRLDTYQTRTGFEITPIVGLVRPHFTPRLDAFEVEEVFEVPLSFILDRANHETHSRVFKGATRHFYVFPFEERYIWGATAGMLVNLSEVLAPA